jgi:translation initiation factor 2 beta subunit (eIF-2beta)/eIF-5
MWAGLTSYRKKRFDGHDSEAETLEDACQSIIEWVDPNRKLKLDDAEAVLADEKRKLAEEAERREQERIELDRQREEEEAKKLAAPRDDDVVRDALKAFEQALAEFEEDYFSTDDVWERNEARMNLWSLLDGAKETAANYYARREQIEQVVTEGTREDHEARLAEYSETVEGQLLHRKNYILALLTILVAQEKEKAARRGRSALKQSKKEIQLSTAMLGAEEFDHRRKRKFKGQVLVEEETTALKYAKKADIAEALKRAHEAEYDWHKKKVISEMLASQEVKRGWRVAEFNRIEHDFVEKHSARDSRWELVWDNRNKRTVYCNLDTLQTTRKHTAICERCDTIFVYHALTCAECGALRSTRNAKYYHKYLTRDTWEDADDDLQYSNKGHNWKPQAV